MDRHETVTDLLRDIRCLSSKVQNLLDTTNKKECGQGANDKAIHYREIINLKWMIHDLDSLVTRVKMYEISHII